MTPPDTDASSSSRIVFRLRLLSLLGLAVVIGAVPTGVMLNSHRPSTGNAATAHAATVDAASVHDTSVAPAPAASSTAAPTQPTDPTTAPTQPTDPAAAATQPAEATPTAPAPADKQLGFDFQYQPTFYFCAPAATHMALSAHGANRSQDDLAHLLGTTTFGTPSAFDTTRVLNEVIGNNVYQTREIREQEATPAEMDRLQADVVHAVGNGYAVVGNIIGAATDASGTWHDFPAGHYIAIVGYRDDGRSVQVADSSGLFGPGTYWMSTIDMANWMATRGYSA